MADDLIEERVPRRKRPDRDRVRSRAATLKQEQRGKLGRAPGEAEDEAEIEAEALLRESDARTTKDPAPRDLKEDRVERRTSDEATPPPDAPGSPEAG